MIDFGLAALFTKLPFLNIPLVKQAVKWVITHFSDLLFTLLKDTINIRYVPFKNQATQKIFVDAALRLKGIAVSDGIDSPKYKAARVEHQTAFAAHVRSLLVPAAG